MREDFGNIELMRALKRSTLSRVASILDTLIKRLEVLQAWVRSQDKSTQASPRRQPATLEKSEEFSRPRSAREARPAVLSPLHLAHCCTVHGCAYGEFDCPVYVAKAEPYFSCPLCEAA